MTSTPYNSPKMPLGIGKIISDSFSILFGNIIAVVMMAFVPACIGLLVGVMTNGAAMTLGVQTGAAFTDFSPVGLAVSTIVQMALQGLTIALLVQLAYDAKTGNAVTPMEYIAPAIKAIVPVAVLSIVIALLAGIAALALIIPGLIVYAMFSVTMPVIMIEGRGFKSMSRSADLTKEYRWPIIGLFLLMFIAVIVFSLVTTTVTGFIVATAGVMVGIVSFALLNTVTAGLLAIMSALLYARLREIKEGVSIDTLAEIFE